MTAADAALLRKVAARIRLLQPALAVALLQSLDTLRAELSDADLRSVLAGRLALDSVLTDDVIARAMRPYLGAIKHAAEQGMRLTLPDIPQPHRRTVALVFDYLDPQIVDAVRGLQSKALDSITAEVREVTRAYIENGLRDGVHFTTVARQLRSVIGIAPHQEVYVANYERELRTLDPKALQRELTDGRLDQLVRKHIASGVPIPEAEIVKRVDSYRENFGAHRTQTVVSTATRDTYRVAQRQAWQQAIDNSYVDGDSLEKTWVHFDAQRNPRPVHVALNGTTVPFDQPYPTGQMTAGDGDYGCRCSDRYSVRRTPRTPAPPAPSPRIRAAVGAFL